jgi:hypothetical protein
VIDSGVPKVLVDSAVARANYAVLKASTLLAERRGEYV